VTWRHSAGMANSVAISAGITPVNFGCFFIHGTVSRDKIKQQFLTIFLR